MPGTPKSLENTLFMINKKLCVLLCLHLFLCAKNFVFNEGYLYSRSFQKLFKDYLEKSKDFSSISDSFSIFKDFSRPVRTMVSQFWMTLNAYCNRFRSLKRSNRAIRLGHFDGIVPSLACILTKQHGVRGGKYLFKTFGNAISETLLFKMSLQ